MCNISRNISIISKIYRHPSLIFWMHAGLGDFSYSFPYYSSSNYWPVHSDPPRSKDHRRDFMKAGLISSILLQPQTYLFLWWQLAKRKKKNCSAKAKALRGVHLLQMHKMRVWGRGEQENDSEALRRHSGSSPFLLGQQTGEAVPNIRLGFWSNEVKVGATPPKFQVLKSKCFYRSLHCAIGQQRYSIALTSVAEKFWSFPDTLEGKKSPWLSFPHQCHHQTQITSVMKGSVIVNKRGVRQNLQHHYHAHFVWE